MGSKSRNSELPPPLPSLPPSLHPLPDYFKGQLSTPLHPFLRSQDFISEVQNSGLKSVQKSPPSFPTDHLSFQVLLEMDSSTGAWEEQTSTEAPGVQGTVCSPKQPFYEWSQWERSE